MRVTIDIDDELVAKAGKLARPLDLTALVREGLAALIEREAIGRAGRQPARVEGGAATWHMIPRGRSTGRTRHDRGTRAFAQESVLIAGRDRRHSHGRRHRDNHLRHRHRAAR